ncbi:hypothetical protein MIND_00258400 [Mycena indigotica]|uniref:AAA-ATPase-like domain-containing protein n=1 Tax=Mycena indigotica TaxID=2126181 RepID=A0A8H6WBB4_9AGAR|nr:uncharacterized protein MIND_00258400 [Mycena indigotica]KAF7312449.1 hypothetical protein MIND_00258400 [Mycena indigotica]
MLLSMPTVPVDGEANANFERAPERDRWSGPTKRIRPVTFTRHIFARGGKLKRLPRKTERFPNILETDGVPYIYKHIAIENFAGLFSQRSPLLLRRPWGFGLSTFVSMLSDILDILCYSDDDDPFEMLSRFRVESDPWSRDRAHSYYVLHLNFSFSEGHNLLEELSRHVHERCCRLLRRYEIPGSFPSLASFQDEGVEAIIFALMSRLKVHVKLPRRDWLFIMIENFDGPLEMAFKDRTETLTQFLRTLQRLLCHGHLGGLLLWSRLDPDGTIYACLHRTPGSPIRQLYASSELNLPGVLDLTHHPAFQSAVGFTKTDVQDLDRATAHLRSDASCALLDLLEKERVAPYYFSAVSKVEQCKFPDVLHRMPSLEDLPVYSSGDVLKVLANKGGVPR